MAMKLNSFSSNLYRDYLKTVALPKLDSIHNVSSNSTSSPLEKLYDNWNSNQQEHGNCTYGSGMNQVTSRVVFTGVEDGNSGPKEKRSKQRCVPKQM